MEIVNKKYKYYYFLPQMFNNEKIFAGSKKAVDLGQKNINKIVRWYNRNKYYNNIKYQIETKKFKLKHIVVKYPLDFNESITSLIDIDKDGNYLLDGYFVAPKN